jgi:hypothetical protein
VPWSCSASRRKLFDLPRDVINRSVDFIDESSPERSEQSENHIARSPLRVSPLGPTALGSGDDDIRFIKLRLRNQVRFGRCGMPPEYQLNLSIAQIAILLNYGCAGAGIHERLRSRDIASAVKGAYDSPGLRRSPLGCQTHPCAARQNHECLLRAFR